VGQRIASHRRVIRKAAQVKQVQLWKEVITGKSKIIHLGSHSRRGYACEEGTFHKNKKLSRKGEYRYAEPIYEPS
jgi:hypothetical protein